MTERLAGRDVLYKTVDSTLRGHIAQELEACFAASGRRSLVFAPAFPQAGRTTVGGIQLVDGIPVSESAYGHDPVHPARHSALVDLVPSSIKNVTFLDAVTQEELDSRIASIEDPESILWVGSPGMAAALVAAFCAAEVLTVIDRWHQQRRSGRRWKRESAQSHTGRSTPGGQRRHAAARTQGARAGSRRRCCAASRRTQRESFGTQRFGALIATGGDTMEAILDLLNVREFEILQELDPGFPLGRARLGNGRLLLLAMKAGGFGR